MIDKRTIDKIAEVLASVEYGTVEITKQAGKVVLITRKESIKM